MQSAIIISPLTRRASTLKILYHFQDAFIKTCWEVRHIEASGANAQKNWVDSGENVDQLVGALYVRLHEGLRRVLPLCPLQSYKIPGILLMQNSFLPMMIKLEGSTEGLVCPLLIWISPPCQASCVEFTNFLTLQRIAFIEDFLEFEGHLSTELKGFTFRLPYLMIPRDGSY